ncbi:MAG TPA: HPr(Ser) kinase/phosphatase, partial [candidate division WOR-3 bacterium]|nr:HPr(Ser) kinase/phosphatase [candidate division WOR-3 bacterium]
MAEEARPPGTEPPEGRPTADAPTESKRMSVGALLSEMQEEWHLRVIAGTAGLDRNFIVTPDIHRPGMALAGHTGIFLADRIQIVGSTELEYLRGIDEETARAAVRRVFELGPPCYIVAKGLELPAVWAKEADRTGIPVLSTPLDTTPFIHRLGAYLDYRLAPEAFVHGELVDVFGVGLLITGQSGIGKSECALDLVDRGHRLIADDIVKILRRGTGILMGYSAARSPMLGHHIEIRGVGIVDVSTLYGVRAIRVQKRIEIEVNLVHWKQGMDYERVGIEDQLTPILGVRIPRVQIPVIPGKNLALVLEVIAKNHILKVFGYHPAKVYNDELMRVMTRSRRVDPFITD